MTTFTARERLYKTPDGRIVGEDEVVDGSTLAAAAGDEMPIAEARALGLVDGTPREPAALLGEREATARADAQRAAAAAGQLEQAKQLAAASSATDAQAHAAVAGDRIRADEAARTASKSVSRLAELEANAANHEDAMAALEQALKERDQALVDQRGTFDASWSDREAEHEKEITTMQEKVDDAERRATDAEARAKKADAAAKKADAAANKQAAKPDDKSAGGGGATK